MLIDDVTDGAVNIAKNYSKFCSTTKQPRASITAFCTDVNVLLLYILYHFVT